MKRDINDAGDWPQKIQDAVGQDYRRDQTLEEATTQSIKDHAQESYELLCKLREDLETNYGSGNLSVETKMLLQEAFYLIDDVKSCAEELNEEN